MTLSIPGDAVAPGLASKDNADLRAIINGLRGRIDELERKTLVSAAISDGQLLVQGTGSIRVIDADGDENFFLGGFTGGQARPDGEPQRVVMIRDDNGQARFAVWDPFPLADGYVQNVYMWDAFGNIALVTDNAGGLALPWFPVTMYPKFNNTTTTFSYMTIDNGLIHAEKQVWEGRIIYVSHPRLQLDGVWGIGSGTSSTPIYNLKINGVTVDTWTQSALTVGQRAPVDISAFLGQVFASIELTVQATTGTGAAIAAQVLGCALRQS